MSTDRSILQRLEERGRDVPRVRLAGSEAPLPGTSASGRYEIVGEIARGGVGVVYRGRDTDLGRDVAMKVLRDEYAQRPELVQRFVEEAQIGGQLQHPGIVPVYELGVREGGKPYFAMKFVKGRTLSELLDARGDVSEDRRALLSHFAQACHTVAYAHSRGVIHRDLKPANVMVGAFGEVQVVDWGFAKVLRRGGVEDERRAQQGATIVATLRSSAEGSASVVGSVMGTPAYMPPEQALGMVDQLTERADVFALGAILCEVLTGAPPYRGTPADVLTAAAQARLDEAYARLDACGADPQLVALARACLSPLPKDRPRTAREVAEVMRAFLSEAERRAREAGLRAAEAEVEVEEQRRARRQTLVVASAVLLVVLLGGGAFLLRSRVAAARERALGAAYEVAMREATRLAATDAAMARAAAERAVGLAAEDETRRQEAATLRDQIQASSRAADRAAKRKEVEAGLLARLDDVLLLGEVDPDPEKADDAYLAALPDLAVANDFDRKGELAVHLDRWADLRRRAAGLAGRDWHAIDRSARALDPDPWRTRLRDELARGDLDALRQRAAGAEIDAEPANAVDVLAVALGERGARDAALDLLRRAAERAPGDLALHVHLARYAERPEARAHLTAALALEPGPRTREILARLH